MVYNLENILEDFLVSFSKLKIMTLIRTLFTIVCLLPYNVRFVPILGLSLRSNSCHTLDFSFNTQYTSLLVILFPLHHTSAPCVHIAHHCAKGPQNSEQFSLYKHRSIDYYLNAPPDCYSFLCESRVYRRVNR